MQRPRPTLAGNGSNRAPGAYLPFPLWARFTVSLVVAVVLLGAMVVFVSGHNTNSPPILNETTAAQANRYAEILVAQDQAPHQARLSSRLAGMAAVELVLRGDVERRIARGAVSGPLQQLRCRATSPPGRQPEGFSCSATAGSVNYRYLAVADLSGHRITYCKRDPPPAPGDHVPVSHRCLA